MNALGAAAALATAVAFCRLSRLSVAARPRCAVCRAGTCYYKPSSGLQTWPPHLLIIAAVCASCPGCGRLAASQLVVGPGAGDGAWHVWALRAAQPRGDRRRARGRRREAGARGGRAGRRRGPRHHARRLPALRPQGAPLPSLWASRRGRGLEGRPCRQPHAGSGFGRSVVRAARADLAGAHFSGLHRACAQHAQADA